MTADPTRRTAAARVAVVATFAATALGLLSGVQVYFSRLRARESVSLWESLLSTLPVWYFWALATPLILWLGRRYPLNARRWRTSLPIHFLCAAALAIPYTLLGAWISYAVWAGPAEGSFIPFIPLVLMGGRSTVGLVFYFALLGAGSALEARDRASTLSVQLAQAQVRALQMQLHPHFLFNTLHAIRVLVREDPSGAERTLVLLGDLLRQTLAGAHSQTVTLRQELAFLSLYLDIERTRFSDRLSIDYDVAPETLELAVPNLILQPLVENAIRHGIAHRSEPSTITVSGRRQNGVLSLSVRNDGPPLAASGTEPAGIGLATTRERLTHLYGVEASLTLRDLPEGGVVAEVRLPVLA